MVTGKESFTGHTEGPNGQVEVMPKDLNGTLIRRVQNLYGGLAGLRAT